MPTRTASSSSRSAPSARKAPARAASPRRASNADRAGKAGRGGAGHGKSAAGDSDDAPSARRAIWKGAISFGLLHVPVALYPASRDQGVDFDWLDKRSMDPVGYKRINKRTGKDIDKTQIVKGVKQDNGDYVLVSDDEIRKAYPTTTQTIEIETFVPATQVSFVYLEKPYYLEPIGKSAKVYALLREAMADAGLIAIARLVIHSKEHLAALLPAGPALMVGMLRWANEIRPCDGLDLPAEGKSTHGFKEGELKMARQLIDEMSGDWHPEDYHDEFTAAIRQLIARKVEQGETETVTPLESVPDESGDGGGNVVDLTELLRRSLGGKKKPKAA
ncbi:Ku protein [Roseateles aquatilis]|uniref:Non-homologous end joining protein Ku n=1 Tax=Roseateles aquatilis TaxID=431061 RepID=A0A246JHM5_9BURK|nr:Ku protein [Roseateles aquatilis]OWQ92134.1 Ku protein [Roseateles aquatilis]